MSRSITPAPSGSLSPDFITVPSTTGFSAGDYVYQKNGDFGLPPSLGTANFNVSPAAPIYGATIGGTSTPVNWYGASVTGDATYVGGSSGRCAAKLTNGNIVIAYRQSSNGNVRFRIVNTDNVEVVAPTMVRAINLTSSAPVGVLALTGGGFVVYYLDNTASSKPAYAIYTDAGVVVAGATVDTTYPTGTAPVGTLPAGCALPNGGFALAMLDNSATAYFRAYGSTGVGVYAWTSNITAQNSNAALSIAARSDNSTCLAVTQSSTTLAYSITNSSGGAIVSPATITIAGGCNASAVVCLTNDTFVIGYRAINNAASPRFRLIPTGNVLSPEFTVPTTNMSTLNYDSASSAVFIKELSGGGFVYFIGDDSGALNYTFYSATGTLLSSAPKACPQIIYFSAFPSSKAIGMVEISGYLSLYHPGACPTASGNAIYEMYNSKISLTDYNLLGSVTTTTAVGAVSTNASTYARSTSLPMKAAYLAANTETLTLNAPMATSNVYTLAPSVVSGTTVNSIKSTTLPDGRFAIVYKDLSTGAISFNVYSIAGVLQTTVAVGTTVTTASYRVRIAALSSGKIAVAYMDITNANIVLNIYSTGYALLATANQAVYAGGSLFDLVGIANDRVALAFQLTTSQYPSTNIFNSSATLIYAHGQYNTNTALTTMNAVASSSGGVWVNWQSAGAGNFVTLLTNTSGNSYTPLFGPAGIGNTQNTGCIATLACNSANLVTFFHASTTTTAHFGTICSSSQNTTVTASSFSSFSTANLSGGNVAVGTTGAGTALCFASGNASGNLYGFVGTNGIYAATAYPYGLLSGINGSASNMQACITPSYGYNAVIAWINTSNIAQYAIVNAYPFTQTQAITAGVTGSAPTTPLNISQSSGYYLAGVAVSDCPAGGTGQIQTNGVANLNSQYSTTTAFQGFDFQNPVTVGVKGTAVGRTVTMIKD